jgi:hypothetical protein
MIFRHGRSFLRRILQSDEYGDYLRSQMGGPEKSACLHGGGVRETYDDTVGGGLDVMDGAVRR